MDERAERDAPRDADGNDLAALSVERARRVKAKYEAFLLRQPNVVSVGVGLLPFPRAPAQPRGSSSPVNSAANPPAGAPAGRQPVLVVCVRREPVARRAPDDLNGDGIPDSLEGVPVTVQVSGDVKAL